MTKIEEYITHNYKTIRLELTRIEVCDLLLACLAAEELSNDDGKKWVRLHEKLKDILTEFDKGETA